MLFVLTAGNIYGFISISNKPQDFLSQFPKANVTTLLWVKVIQALNIVSLVGIWYWKKWAVWMALALVLLVLLLDVYYGIYYHIAVVLVTCGLTAWFIVTNWALFR